MLNEQTTALIKASVPVLKTRGEDITRHFYELVFRDYPEMTAFFNQSHQAEGTQQRALADAVLAYAEHIDNLGAISPALPAIIHKHVSLGIRADQYPIVGSCLLRAIADVLGDAASPELMDAWGKAYGQLADLLIQAEEDLSQQIEQQPGGWRGERVFKVIRKQPESEIITSFYLAPADGGPTPIYQPGQYLALVLTINGTTVRRNYSLSDAPGSEYLRISVKRESDGLVSNHLHASVDVGDTLNVLPPCGDFILDDSDAPLLMVSGGVGITPLLAMLKPALESDRKVMFVHAARNSQHHGFRAELSELAIKHSNLRLFTAYDEALPGDKPDHLGRINAELLNELAGEAKSELKLYLLGPKPFMQSVYRDAVSIGINEPDIHLEFFGPKQAMSA